MKERFVCLLPALALLLLSTLVGRADQFDRIENSPYTYWVPAHTTSPAYANGAAPQPYYYGPPPPGYYYGPPPPPAPVVFLPHFFIGFHFH